MYQIDNIGIYAEIATKDEQFYVIFFLLFRFEIDIVELS